MRRLLAVFALVGAASCSSPFEPAELAGTYTATRLAGHALPFTYNAGVKSYYVIADSVILRPDGTGRFGTATEVVDMELDTRTLVRDTREILYSINGSTLVITTCNNICATLDYNLKYRIVDGQLIRGDSYWQKRSEIE